MDLYQLNPLFGRTNTLPSDEETAELRRRLPILEKELHRLDIDISLLLAKRARLVSQIDRFTIAIAPHKRLPPELIGQIFRHCVEGPAVLPLADGKNDPRLTITQICSVWRRIAFDVAKLWDVEFNFSSSIRLSPGSLGCVDLVAAWLSQCNSTSISLRVLPRNMRSSTVNNNVKRLDHVVSSVVVPNAHRFRSLVLILSNRGVESLLSLPGDSFPAVEQLYIMYINSIHPDIPTTAFSHASRLCEVGFFSINPVDPILQLPWSQLTSLSIQLRPQKADAYLTALSSCTSLISLTIKWSSDLRDGLLPVSHSIWRPQGPFHLRRLRALIISFRAQVTSDALLFLLQLELPRLHQLVLQHHSELMHDDTFLWSQPAFTAFFMSISSSLKYFEVFDTVGRLVSTHQLHHNLESLITCIPAARNVKLSNSFPLLPSTMAQIGTGALLPLVEVLHFAAQDPNTAIKMIITRQAAALATSGSAQPVSRLQRVEIRCSQVVPMEALRDLRSSGLNITTRTR
jgi:hypothetical protein